MRKIVIVVWTAVTTLLVVTTKIGVLRRPKTIPRALLAYVTAISQTVIATRANAVNTLK